MKKHLSRGLALLLAVVMVLSLLPAMVFATEAGEGASFINGLPEDGTYGVIYSCGDGYSFVMGADIALGIAPALAVEKTEDGEAIKSLPDGTAVIKFLKNPDGTYYFLLGSKYLVLKDVDTSKEQLILCDTAEAGAKWSVIADKAGMEGAYNIMNAEYKWNGKYDVYMEQYNGQKFCGYSYPQNPDASNVKHFQFQFAGTSADEDGRIGDVQAAAALPENGDKVVIYCDGAKAVLGQPTGPDAPKPNLLGAPAKLGADGTLAYDDIADGGLIFEVTISGGEYTFKTGDKYLSMSKNYQEDGKTRNDETLLLDDEESEYTKWKVSQINGGWLMTNKAALWGSNPVVIEYFDELFCGYSYYAGDDSKYAVNFYKVNDKYNCGYVVNPSIEITAPAPAIGTDCTVKFKVNDLNELKTLTAGYAVDAGALKEVTPEYDAAKKVGVFTVPKADLEGKKTLSVNVSAKDAMDLTFDDTKTVDIKDEPLILEVAPAANSATGADNRRPEISATYANAGADPTIVMTVDKAAVTPTVTADKISYKAAADMSLEKHTVSVTITRKDGKEVSKTWSFFVGEGGETLYFGQVHAHTAEYSDGAGTLEQAYEHAHEVDNLDYIVITDHSNYFDTTKTATTSSYYDLSSLTKNAAGTVTKWEEARVTADYYNKLYEDFVCIYGYEMTWSGGPGHTNSFNTFGTLSRNNTELNNKAGYAGMHLYNDMIVNADRGLDNKGEEAVINRVPISGYTAEMNSGNLAIKAEGAAEEAKGVYATKYIPFDEEGKAVPVVSQFNHPGITFGNFDNYAGYTALRDSTLNLIEVGNGEGKVGGSAYFPSYAEYDLCLSLGWHVGPTNNQDNHKGNWGDSNTCRDVILTDDFSEIGIYRALSARRIYATEDQNLEIYYTMKIGENEYKLGDVVNAKDVDKVTAKVTISDPDGEGLGKIFVIGEGSNILAEKAVDGSYFSGEFELKNDNGFYYVKVVQADGDIAVTAPVWTAEAVPASASIKTDAAVAVQGVEENITATFTNGGETEPMTLIKYVIQAGDKTIASKTVNETVAAGKSYPVTVPFTPPVSETEEIESYDIRVIFQFEYQGEKDKREAKMKETSYPPSKMTYIGIDNGHKNFYVSGDYAKNETSFIQICADNGIICEYISEGQMTKENLLKDGKPRFKLIVLTVPRIDETTMPPVWTEEELAAIKAYADAGGNIINLSKSDRYDYSEMVDGKDTYKYASANISNLVNEAIGAKSRFVRGIVVDNEMKANEAYRIYFKGSELVNADHPFTQAIITPSNGEGYQYYNGTGVAKADGVTPLISPYPSTWIACYKDNFTGSSYVPDYAKDTVMAKKGEFDLVTYEELSGGGFLVCAGAAFISNYDLKSGTPDAQQYENYLMVRNILEYVKNGGVPEVEVTEIQKVHDYGDAHGVDPVTGVGAEFTVEGWVTSNASDFDADTAFFDCIYIQDETRGINLFPVSGNFFIGEKVRTHGAIQYYCGEIELNLKPENNGYIKVIADELNVLEPAKVSCAVAMSNASIGNLVEISGIVKDIHRTEGVVDYIYVDDGSGVIGTLFINNYIQKDYKGLDNIEVGMAVRGVGIGSRDVDETGTSADGVIRRLRVRSREEIIAYNDPCGAFTDVDRSSWYHDAVDYVLENEYMAGTTTGETNKKFEPYTNVSRAMVAVILSKIGGADTTAPFAGTFTDVPAGQWFTPYIEWCAKNGLASGRGDGRFDPNGLVTRQELASFMYRLAQYLGYDVSAKADITTFPDGAKADDWAKEALAWAVGFGIISGRQDASGTYLQPQGTAVRAELASIIMRMMEKFKVADEIIVLYTNDVHCGVDQSMESIGIAGLALYKKQMQAEHKNVVLVDNGDAIQGGLIGTISKGEYIIDLMNYVGYDFAALGNHEFDYTMPQLKSLIEKAGATYLSSNFRYIGEGENPDALDLKAYEIVDYGGLKVAYVGITTPESLTKSTPSYFMDKDGNWIYTFNQGGNGQELYDAVQEAVNNARNDGATVVVALAHLGIDEQSAPWRSTDVIRNTTGIDVMLDGHSHSTIACQEVNNKDGKTVLLSSTGTKLANIGKLTITPAGEVKTELIGLDYFDLHLDEEGNLVKNEDPDTAAYLAEINAKFEALKQQVVAHVDYDLLVNDPETGTRMVRLRETNMGDVAADAYRTVLGADIAFVNGGGVRANIKAGDVTYENIINVHPFGNMACMVETTGQQILDALEMSARNVHYDEEGKLTGENGGFLQVSGLKFNINLSVESTVKLDEAGLFASVEGARRVQNVEVLQADGSYAPLDPAAKYTLASHNYMLKEGGDGLNMFMKDKLVLDEVKVDNQVLIEYMTSEAFEAHDYSNWQGEGRITFTTEACTHPETEIVGAKPASCTEAGYTGDTVCKVCGEVVATGEAIPATGHKDEDEDGKCDVCGQDLGDVFTLSTTLKEGDQVVIYYPAGTTALGKTVNSDKRVDPVAIEPTGTELTPTADAAVFTVHFVDETNFTLLLDGVGYLTSEPTGNGVSFAADATEYSQWYLEVKDADAKTVFVRSTNAAFNDNKNQALEYYKNGFTTYGWKDNDFYTFQLFVKAA